MDTRRVTLDGVVTDLNTLKVSINFTVTSDFTSIVTVGQLRPAEVVQAVIDAAPATEQELRTAIEDALTNSDGVKHTFGHRADIACAVMTSYALDDHQAVTISR